MRTQGIDLFATAHAVVLHGLDAITAPHGFEAACAGDNVAISSTRDAAKHIGLAVAQLAATADPEVIVARGLVSAASDVLAEAGVQETGRRLPPGSMDHLRVEFSTLGDEAVAIGAARLPMTSTRE